MDKKKSRRSTKTRRMILEILGDSQRPLSAAEVHEMLLTAGSRQSLSTVYRALDSFAEDGTLLKGMLIGTAHYQVNAGLHTHFAVCTGCSDMVPVKGCPLTAVQVVDDGFEVMGHSLELYGLCGSCKESRTAGK